MYYQSRVYVLVQAKNACDAARKIKSREIQTNEVLSWKSRNGEFQMYAVPDGHLDEMMCELAILRKPIAADSINYQQIESITNAWIEGAHALGKCLEEAETSDLIMQRNAQLIIDKPKGDEMASSTCGCCGAWFKGNVQEQLKFDQDAGYGLCDNCR
jgi:hypothetical protein